MTSQSTLMVLSFKNFKSTACLNDRPINLWISIVLPLCFPRADSLFILLCVDLGSIPYSAVIQPSLDPRIHLGTPFSMVAVQMTCVSPNLTNAEPSACLFTPISISIGLIWFSCLLLILVMDILYLFKWFYNSEREENLLWKIFYIYRHYFCWSRVAQTWAHYQT